MSASIDAPDGIADAYIVRPDDGASHPGVLFYTDLMGIRPAMTKMADRLAAAGYSVLMPNVFYRHGPSPTVEMPDVVPQERVWEIAGAALQVSQHLSPEDSMRDAEAWLDWLATDELTNDGAVGVTGYCHGGMLCVRTAGTFADRVAAAAIIHGSHLITDAPDSPHFQAEKIRGEVFFANGDADIVNTPEDVKRLQTVLDAAGVSCVSEMYPGAQHGFTAEDFPSMYDAAGAERHWIGMLDLFGRTL